MKYKVGDTVAYSSYFWQVPRSAKIDRIDHDDCGRVRVWGFWGDALDEGFVYMDDDLILVERGHGPCPMEVVK